MDRLRLRTVDGLELLLEGQVAVRRAVERDLGRPGGSKRFTEKRRPLERKETLKKIDHLFVSMVWRSPGTLAPTPT